MASYADISIEKTGFVAVITIRKPPHNYFDISLIRQIADATEALDQDSECRSYVLAAEGKSFCAGALFRPDSEQDPNRVSGGTAAELYREAVRLFRIRKPIVAAVHGAAIGGGLGLALVADFRVTCPQARFSANFTRLGFHPGFGLSVTLPRLVGVNHAELIMFTGRRLTGEQAVAMGLANVLVEQDAVLDSAVALATEIAESAPLAVMATRATLRGELADQVRKAVDHEAAQQGILRQTNDFQEGIRASAERRTPVFQGN